jgi:phenylacetate-CoA ligase
MNRGLQDLSALSTFGNWQKAACLVHENSQNRFVQRQLARSRTTVERVASNPGAWAELAFVTKDDLLEDQRLAPPFGMRCAKPIEEIGVVVESSGTTAIGKEVHYISHQDYKEIMRNWSISLRRMGFGASDIVAMTFPVNMSGGGVKHVDAYLSVGAKVLRLANLSTRAKLDAIAYYGATALVATPYYVNRLAAVASEAGIDVAKLKVHRIIVATQSVTIDWVQSTERRWGAKLYEWYGTSAGLIAFSCEHGMVDEFSQRGTLHWDPDFELIEILDIGTGRWVSGEGRGELVGTPFCSTAEPLFRIRTRDEVKFRAPGTCRCGTKWPGIESGTVRRLDSMLKVKGVDVSPAHVEACLFALETVRDYRARVTLDGQGREAIRIDVLVRPGGSHYRLGKDFADYLRQQTSLGFEVFVTEDPSEWLHMTTGEAAKPRRWVDERMK